MFDFIKINYKIETKWQNFDVHMKTIKEKQY